MALIECPVCTLYLRADMSLEEHLGTHPTDKVIKALVTMATKVQTPTPSAPASTAASPVAHHSSTASPMELAMMAVASGSRPRTPPNALMYHTGGYEPMKQAAPPPPPPPPPAPQMVQNSAVPTAITVVKASDMGYPINNVMIVKSCSTKYVQQIPQTGNSGLGSSSGTATIYPSSSLDGRNVFIEHDRGGSGHLVSRRQVAPPPSFYPRYTNERYSGPPPPYSTAITSTISANSQLQQASMTAHAPKYEHKTTLQSQQSSFCSNTSSQSAIVGHVTATPTMTQHQQQQIYQAHPPPPPALEIQQPAVAIHQPNQQLQLQTTNFKHQNMLQAQYTEKEDGNFLVTENPKKVVEYTENDEGDFMVIEKIVKSPPRIVQIDEEMPEEASTSKSCDQLEKIDDLSKEYAVTIDDDESYEEASKEDQSEENTIEIIENEDGTFDDNRGSFSVKEMPKPMLISSIGSSKKCNKFNLIVDTSPHGAVGASSSGMVTPRKRPTSGLKVLSNVKVTTDLSQGIKDIILNLNSKNKATNVTGSNGSGCSTSTGEGTPTSLIAGTKPTAVINNNCQNELIINAGSNMPPIDLNNVNDIEIINDDEEENRSDEEEECYVGSMEVKAATSDAFRLDKDTLEAGPSHSASRTTPTPSVITSVIRMTPHSSPVVVPLASPQPTNVVQPQISPNFDPIETMHHIETAPNNTETHVPESSCVENTVKQPPPPQLTRKPPQTTGGCSSGHLLFNKPPKKLTVKLKTPLPPAPPPTPPLVAPGGFAAVVPKTEHIASGDSMEYQESHRNDFLNQDADSEVLSAIAEETKYAIPQHDQSEQIPIPSADDGKPSSSNTSLNAPSSSNTFTTYITTKIENDAQVTESVVFSQSSLTSDSTNCSKSVPSPVSLNPNEGHHSSQDATTTGLPVVTTQEIVQTTTTTTTEVECYNITFIDDDEGGILNDLPGSSRSVAIHDVIAQNLEISNDNCTTTTIVKQDEEVEQKADCNDSKIEITEIYALSPVSAGQIPSDTENLQPTCAPEEFEPTELKSCIKIEKIEKLAQNEEELSNDEHRKEETEHKIAKIEPSLHVSSSSIYQNDQKDLLEAGPSRDIKTAADSNDSGSGSGNNAENIEPTFLEYNEEYDEYVPVSGYIPQEQIPLSWVQKFSPQYTPFDDQNSYMDLDMCSSKTNSNSVGENTTASSRGSGSGGSGGSHGSHRIVDNSMDRAPSAESLNIRTDEKMPAKGEISEQESNGDMELSWNRLYPVHENIPIYPSSYDLSTAQECWNLSNRHSNAHNTNSSSSSHASNHNHPHMAGPSSSSSNMASSGHHLGPHASYHQSSGHHQSHGMSFQFAQHGDNRADLEEQIDDKSKIRLDYGISCVGGNYGSMGPSGSGSGALNDDASRKLVKIRTYRCTECPKSFATLKQRRTHILSEHETDLKVNVLGATGSATVTSGASSSTVTSASTLGFFSGPATTSAGEGCSTSLLNKKIKIEPQPVLMSYSSLKQELEQKQEGGEIAGPATVVAGSSGGNGEIRRKRTYVCGTCKHEFDRFKLFNAHLMVHPAECYTCGRSFKHWPNFALHIKRHLGIKDHQCRLCGKKFVIKQKLIEHMRVHTGKAPIKCPDCDQHFRRFSNLAQHRNRHHLNKVPSKKDFVCHCGEVFQSKAKMEWHKEIHENKPKSCPFCREKFIHKNSLTRHIRLSHTEKYVKLETATEMCTLCNQPYIKTSMKRHMETHNTNERMAFSCTICNKVFSTNWNLKQHRWTHANPTLKPFQCNMCSSGFVREADYITHMNAHKSIRPYTCNHCGCQFIRKYNWIRHTREHETDKNYTCEICGRKFHRKYYLTEHKRIHTGERPFSCNICGKTSSTKTNHNKHIKIHHARDPLTAEG
ncbi:uncharacterized protein LOC109423029 isoform X1 [Aedes albopictus]|uniref:C2H2-type domain-containing protein n=1 Tax=Aedes albopictus TaxID=7160 RepID=A0ABM1Z0B2_AEDAL